MELSCIVFLLFYRTSNKNEVAKVSRIDDDDDYDKDTDDELNELREAQKREKVSKPTLPAKTSVADMYGEETDEEDEKPDMEIKQNFVKTVENVVKKEVIDPYDVDTDIGKRHALKRYEQFSF